ncbi:uncharacterized protein J7T54_003853 [Emericellopsis cladophorae]|uniref:Glycosyltransferase family 2 protein n=1 Tax=Emericellopsis cladophorae TaxID=2686198 RepID=A0A9P9XW47_9HYPO|nr:uncharacterized protein J7T54_003853 [Emericellopsis cladophorae]KAI6778917.1 hypothetical protein J7T54_003853 [Emericellopsis cladophorae]
MPGIDRETVQAWLPRIALILAFGGCLTSTWLLLVDTNVWLAVFCTLFALRYVRLFGHLVGYWSYRPSPVQPDPSFTRKDVTVILPTIDPNGPDFQECIRSILANGVASIIVITVGAELKAECRRVLGALALDAGATSLCVSAIDKPSKRRQINHAIPHITTAITILADDHVFFPTANFIPAVLAPFDNEKVGVVATKKRVRRTTPGKWTWLSIVNFVACNYLERHNWELRASNAIDGGVFVVSGRTAVYRTDLLTDQELLRGFCDEKFFLGRFELNPDDDNYLTRNTMEKGWLIRFQDTEDATIETTLGEWPKINGQLLRWARTTFRSNPIMLRNPDFLYRYTWSAFQVYLAGMLNFAALWDVLLIFTLVRASQAAPTFPAAVVVILILWIIATKAIKLIPHFFRHPADLQLFVFQVLFAYVHSFFKLWALVTFWDCGWSGRNLDDVNGDENDKNVLAFEVVV